MRRRDVGGRLDERGRAGVDDAGGGAVQRGAAASAPAATQQPRADPASGDEDDDHRGRDDGRRHVRPPLAHLERAGDEQEGGHREDEDEGQGELGAAHPGAGETVRHRQREEHGDDEQQLDPGQGPQVQREHLQGQPEDVSPDAGQPQRVAQGGQDEGAERARGEVLDRGDGAGAAVLERRRQGEDPRGAQARRGRRGGPSLPGGERRGRLRPCPRRASGRCGLLGREVVRRRGGVQQAVPGDPAGGGPVVLGDP